MKCFRTAFLGLFLFVSTLSYSQSFDAKYDSLIQVSETFKIYKVIPKTSLDLFWSEVTASLSEKDQAISDLQLQVEEQGLKVESLVQDNAAVQAELDASLTQNDSINFLGLLLSKLSYHIIVWSLILILTGLGILAYTMFFRSNKLTVRHRKELENLEREFERHKQSAREKQVKLKRELQTAINQLDARGKMV